MITQMLLLDFKVVEIPAVMHARTSGKSMHSGLKPIWYMMRMFYSVLAVIFRCKVLKMDAGAGRIDVEREDKSILSWQKGREAKGRAEKKEFPELRGKQDKKELFQKAILQESRKAIQNPGCGWYHLYTFNAAQTGEPLYIACEEEELVLLRIDIGAFRDKPISEPSLEWIRRILAFFGRKEKE